MTGSRRPKLIDYTSEWWNEHFPIGTAVRYYQVIPPTHSYPPVETRTRSEAWDLGDGSAVVSVEGKTGGVSLAHIEVLIMKETCHG